MARNGCSVRWQLMVDRCKSGLWTLTARWLCLTALVQLLGGTRSFTWASCPLNDGSLCLAYSGCEDDWCMHTLNALFSTVSLNLANMLFKRVLAKYVTSETLSFDMFQISQNSRQKSEIMSSQRLSRLKWSWQVKTSMLDHDLVSQDSS